ncbi:hypothetical protein D0863_10747 [Hortaea werneckii]|uniref:Uncharacterized protein n=1 Tax=Hortaea werneckii TaxID=91943 RepID=A0A3M7DGC6_HORWE|nr:hypothetical protein D0863_10747 [Hortaea werneckii]
MSWRFKLCGQGEDGPAAIARPPLDDDHPKALRVRFSIPKDEKLHFHFEDEDCKKLRPFKDLYERWTLEKVDGRLIFLHSKAPLRLASRPAAKDDSGPEEHVDIAEGNELYVASENDGQSEAAIAAKENVHEQYDTSGDAEQSPVEPQAEDSSDDLDYVSEDSEHSELGSQVEKNSDEQHDVSGSFEQSKVGTQAEENSDAGNAAQGESAATTAEPQDTAGQKYMVLVQGGMHPHAISTSSMPNTDHQCKIRFRVEQHKTLDRDWSNLVGLQQDFMTPETALLRDLPGMIKERLARVLHDEAGKKNDLAKKYRRIIFRLSVIVQAYGRVEIDLHDPKYGLRFRSIQDCMLIPGMEESQLEVIVRAQSTDVERPTDRSERRASKAALEGIDENEMIQAIPLDENVNSSFFRRIGNHEIADRISSGHPYARPLIAEIWNDKIDLRKGDASLFDDELVGDVRNGIKAGTGKDDLEGYELAPQYIVKAPKSLNKTNLFALIHKAGPPKDDLERLPILPPLSFNLFSQDSFGTTADKSPRSQSSGETQRSADSMTAVVRLVNHLTSERGRVLVFHNDTEIGFEETDTYAVAEQEVINSAKLFQDKSNGKTNGYNALKPGSKDPGYLELFVRPQLPAPQKLFRIPTTGEGSDGKMIGFLSTEEVNKDNRTVYMEAHVWPKERLLPEEPAAES